LPIKLDNTKKVKQKYLLLQVVLIKFLLVVLDKMIVYK